MPETNYQRQYLRYSRYFRQLTGAYRDTPALRASLEFLLTLFTISFFALFALRPTINTIAELWANINSQRQIKTRLEQKIRDLAVSQEIWKTEQKRMETLDRALPKNPGPDTYIKQIEGLAASRGLGISFLKVDEVALRGEVEKQGEKKTKGQKTETISVSLLLSGSYAPLLGFLEDLENLRRVTDTTSVSFTTTKGVIPGQTVILLTVANEVPYYKGGKK